MGINKIIKGMIAFANLLNKNYPQRRYFYQEINKKLFIKLKIELKTT